MQIRSFRQLASPISFLLAVSVTGCGEALFLDPAPNALAAADAGASSNVGIDPPGSRTIVVAGGDDAGAASGPLAAAWTASGPVVFYPSTEQGKRVVRGAFCTPQGSDCAPLLVSPGAPRTLSAASAPGSDVVYVAWSDEGVAAIARCDASTRTCGVPLRSAASDIDDPSLVVHAPTGEIFVAVAAAEGRHGVLRCDGGLSSCTYFAVNALGGLPAGTGLAPRIAMFEDPAEPRYHILSRTADGGLYELACGLDGTACIPDNDVAAKVGSGYPLGYAGAVDDAARRFVGAASTAGGGVRSFSFLVDYGNVTAQFVSAGQPASVDAFLDAPRGRFVVAAGGGVLRCGVDGTGCAEAMASAGGIASAAAYDPATGTTYVFSVRADGALALAKVGP